MGGVREAGREGCCFSRSLEGEEAEGSEEEGGGVELEKFESSRGVGVGESVMEDCREVRDGSGIASPPTAEPKDLEGRGRVRLLALRGRGKEGGRKTHRHEVEVRKLFGDQDSFGSFESRGQFISSVYSAGGSPLGEERCRLNQEPSKKRGVPWLSERVDSLIFRARTKT